MRGGGSRLCQFHYTDTIGEQARLTAPRIRPPATLSDEPALDAALFRAYHHLSGYWLHAFRGLLNGISLNLLVLGNATAGAPRDLLAASVKTQLKELDSALTCWLDLSALDETSDGLCDVLSLLEHARSFVEPLARSRRIAVELSSAVSRPFCNADPRVLFAVLVPTLVNVLLHASEGSALRIVLEDDTSGILSVEVRPDAGADAGAADLGFRDAARRALRIRGGDIRDLPDGGTTGLRLLLQRTR